MKITLSELKQIIRNIIRETPIDAVHADNDVYNNFPINDYFSSFKQTPHKYVFIFINQEKNINFQDERVNDYFKTLEKTHELFLRANRNDISDLINIGAIQLPQNVHFDSIQKNQKIIIINSNFFKKDNVFNTAQAIKHDISHTLIDFETEQDIYALFDNIWGAVLPHFNDDDVYNSIYGDSYDQTYKNDQLPNFIATLIDLDINNHTKFLDELDQRLSIDNFINNLTANKIKRYIKDDKSINTIKQPDEKFKFKLKILLETLKQKLKFVVNSATEILQDNTKVSLLGFKTIN